MAAPGKPKVAESVMEANRPASHAVASAPAGRGAAEPGVDSPVRPAPKAVNEKPAPKAPAAEPESPLAGPVVAVEAPAVNTKPEAPAPKPAAPATKAEPRPQPKAVATEEKAAAKDVAPKPPAPPALDLAALEKRLRETSAIGVFTKLTLKNQVDDLLARFRGHYEGKARTTLAQLRQAYESLILKVVSLLQDGDPSLARAIVDSREAIWSILSDREKFFRL